MEEKIIVTPQKLKESATNIENLAADYQRQYKALFDEASELSAKWQGKDYKAFVEQIGGFEDDLRKMHKLMNDYATYLRNTANSYEETQRNVVIQARQLIN